MTGGVERPSSVEQPTAGTQRVEPVIGAGGPVARVKETTVMAPYRSNKEVRASSLLPVTAVNTAIAEHFSTAEWTRDGRDTPVWDVGLDDSVKYHDSTSYPLVYPEKTWLAGLYGARIVPDGGNFAVETVDLPTMVEMQQTIADTVLEGEDARVAVLTDPPHPELRDQDPENNNLWLKILSEGGWPVMRDKRIEEDRYDYSTHDLDIHLGNSMLFPREIQTEITEAAGHERAFRLEHGYESEQTLVLPGDVFPTEDTADDPLGVSGMNGIDKLDTLTDLACYQDLIAYLVDVPDIPVEKRLETLRRDADKGVRGDIGNTGPLIETVRVLPHLVRDLRNYNTRHREGRNATPEELAEVTKGVFTGLVRVAEKIRDAYIPKQEHGHGHGH